MVSLPKEDPLVMLEPREYQADALDRTAAAEARGIRRQLGVAATGLGKTVMFALLAQRRGGRALVLAHRDELVQQAAAKIREIWPEADVGIVKAGENDVRAQVVVASVQTLSRPKRLGELLAPFTDELTLLGKADPFGLVVVDEAHHAAADSYRTILSALRAGVVACPEIGTDHDHERIATPEEVDAGCELGIAYDDCPGVDGPLLLGVTATPDRGDGKGLDDLFDEVVWSYDILWGIRSGYLSDLRGKRVTVADLDLSGVKITRGDYEAGAAGRALEDAGAPEVIVRSWLEHAAGRRTLVFTPTVELARLVAAEFVGAGVAAGMVSGETPMDERRQILRDYSAGRIQVLANCAVLTEGYDEPRTDCIVMARPTKSRALYTQCVGRGTRKHPEKVDCLVLDVVGVTAQHSLVTVPSLFGIEHAGMETGAALASEAVAEWEQDQIRIGKIRAEDVELFHTLRASMAWVATHHQGYPRRYVLGLGKEQGSIVLAELDCDDPEHGWAVQHQRPEGNRTLLRGSSMELCQGVGEDRARTLGVSHLTDAAAGWRKRKPTDRQLDAARKWRLPNRADYQTAGELADALTAHIESKRSRKRANA